MAADRSGPGAHCDFRAPSNFVDSRRGSVQAGGRAIGIYGGTFDPPHVGHLAVADGVRDCLGLDTVYLLPAPCPPHKGRPGTPFRDRVAMVEAMVYDCPGLKVLDVESRLPEPHYTYRTLEYLRLHEFPGVDIYLIIGADSLEELHTWRHYEALFELARIVAVTRPGHALRSSTLSEAQMSRIIRVDNIVHDVSSSAIREALARGEKPESIQESVYAILMERGLYDQKT